MNKAFVLSSLPDDEIKKIGSLISKYNGELCSNVEEADLIIVENISYRDYSSDEFKRFKAKLILTYRCLLNMDFELINPFTYKTEKRYLQNIFLRNKSFCFIDTAEATIKHCTYLIDIMDGQVFQTSPDYYITDSKESKKDHICISTSWLYSLQNSSVYIYPNNFVVNKESNKSNSIKLVKQIHILPQIEKNSIKEIKKSVLPIPILKRSDDIKIQIAKIKGKKLAFDMMKDFYRSPMR